MIECVSPGVQEYGQRNDSIEVFTIHTTYTFFQKSAVGSSESRRTNEHTTTILRQKQSIPIHFNLRFTTGSNMNQAVGTKQRKQPLLFSNSNSTNISNNHHSSGNGPASNGGASRSSLSPPSYLWSLIYHMNAVANMVATKVGLHHNVQYHHDQQLVRFGGLFCVIVTSYIVLSSLIILLHSYTPTYYSLNGSIIPQQQPLPTTPLYLTNSEHDLISKVLGIDKTASSKNRRTTPRQSKQCASSSVNIRIPPTTLRKGKSRFVTEMEYQNQAVQLVQNIRVLLGTATQLGTRSSTPTTTTFLENANTNVTSPTALSSPGSQSQQQQQQQHETSFEDAVIMDFGCGPGRLLIGLLSANVCFAKYIGVDVSAKDIKWLYDTYNMSQTKKRNDKTADLQRRDDEQLQFIRINVKNERYNKNGQTLDTDSLDKKERIVFPSIEMHNQLEQTVDVMILRSVFSHMLTADIYHHLRTLHPILKAPTGVMIVSLFLNPIPDSPVETVETKEEQERGNHLVYISKQVFETIVYETGYSIILYMSQWNAGEDVYVLSSNGRKAALPLFQNDIDDLKVEDIDLVEETGGGHDAAVVVNR